MSIFFLQLQTQKKQTYPLIIYPTPLLLLLPRFLRTPSSESGNSNNNKTPALRALETSRGQSFNFGNNDRRLIVVHLQYVSPLRSKPSRARVFFKVNVCGSSGRRASVAAAVLALPPFTHTRLDGPGHHRLPPAAIMSTTAKARAPEAIPHDRRTGRSLSRAPGG